MNNVEIIKTGGEITAHTPYNPAFPAKARKLGGRWRAHDKTWVFDGRDEDRVRKACRDVYGTDGSDGDDVVDLRVTYAKEALGDRAAVYFAGREVARAYGRDSGAKLGEGVVQLEGRIGSSGSRQYWCTQIRAGSVFELRDVPRAAAEKAIAGADADEIKAEVVNGASELDALKAKREALKAELAEVEARIAAKRSSHDA